MISTLKCVIILIIDPTAPLIQAYHGGPFYSHGGDGIMKDPKTIDQQVQILINRGLIINNIELAKEFLIKLIITDLVGV